MIAFAAPGAAAAAAVGEVVALVVSRRAWVVSVEHSRSLAPCMNGEKLGENTSNISASPEPRKSHSGGVRLNQLISVAVCTECSSRSVQTEQEDGGKQACGPHMMGS
jgi:hypothetical protein